MQRRKIKWARDERLIYGSQRGCILGPVLLYQFRQDRIAPQPPACGDTQHKITSSSRRSAISVYERMDVIEPPKNVCCQYDWIDGTPISIHFIYEIVH
jgi:hypothetical protein